ncbi:signal peptidase I [Virgibacillus dakarensis]|uniref:Signal peptidase I n=1 Tax=Lentibacillus populi TaxID=1827502 RepID=A0A9W5X745_9BACI|nr:MULTISPECIES: signal peptidase I [Bacillaceae]MBT2215475.1 signal peptidase I [Virgibacillus dakarensis]MTW86237.1 signal peptidase I [Virgibacillus dakarensis]GGB52791.1 S26 family signal peptidase [Lentibacillus populi]
MKPLLKWGNRILTVLIILFIVSVAALVLSNKLTNQESGIFGYQLKTVLSGSMEPGIQTGSIIAIKSVDEEESKKFQAGDVITFQDEDKKLISHRIADVTMTDSGVKYTTKGDNNDAADIEPVLPNNVVGEYQGLTVPYVGYLIHFAQSPNGILLLMIVPGVILLGYSAFTIWSMLRKLENKNQSNSLEMK